MRWMCTKILKNCKEFRRNNLENLGNFHFFEKIRVSKGIFLILGKLNFQRIGQDLE